MSTCGEFYIKYDRGRSEDGWEKTEEDRFSYDTPGEDHRDTYLNQHLGRPRTTGEADLPTMTRKTPTEIPVMTLSDM